VRLNERSGTLGAQAAVASAEVVSLAESADRLRAELATTVGAIGGRTGAFGESGAQNKALKGSPPSPGDAADPLVLAADCPDRHGLRPYNAPVSSHGGG
jgi:hypothetical protein